MTLIPVHKASWLARKLHWWRCARRYGERLTCDYGAGRVYCQHCGWNLFWPK